MSYVNQRLNVPYSGTTEIGNPDDRLTRQNTLLLTAEVGLSERFSLEGSLPLRTVDITGREDVSAEGVGDLDLKMRTSLTNPEGSKRVSAVAFYGAALPTGKKSDPSVLEENAQFSRGVVTGIAGGEISVKVGAKSLIYGRAEAQLPIGDDDGYRFAATRQASGTYSMPFGASKVRWLAGLDFRYAGRDKEDLAGDGRGPVAVPNRGGHQTRLLGGVLVPLTEKQNVGLIAGYLLSADLPGDQLTSRVEYVVGWQGTFGTHRHPTH